jgi:hypothetical protein
MKRIRYKRSILILIGLALIFALGVTAPIAQEKQIRDFLKSKGLPAGAQAAAETLKFRLFNHVTKAEMYPIADVEGHFIIANVREGTIIFENGELGWLKGTLINDVIRGAGTIDMYSTFTLQDGSTITTRAKGTAEAAPQAGASVAKFTGDIIHGTGRFQGIRGTMTSSAKVLPPEKGEMAGKALGDVTLVYTLPPK